MPDTETTETTVPEQFTLYAPDGREYVTTSLAESVRLQMNAGYSDTPPTAVVVDDQPPFDPAEHTVDQVLAFIDEHPDQSAAVLASEAAGKNRTSLVGS